MREWSLKPSLTIKGSFKEPKEDLNNPFNFQSTKFQEGLKLIVIIYMYKLII